MKGDAAVNEVERRFHRAMIGIYETAKRELGYNATRFLQMVSAEGGLVTARQLLWSDTPSDGFTTLWEHHRLDLTVEDHVLRAKFASLFSAADREQALTRLKEVRLAAKNQHGIRDRMSLETSGRRTHCSSALAAYSFPTRERITCQTPAGHPRGGGHGSGR